MLQLLGLAMPLLDKVFDRVLPDEEQKAEAKRALLAMQGTHELKLLEAQLSAIVAEAQSQDPYTSRARPSFLYVVYAYILAGIPMGFLFAMNPEAAMAVADGTKAWLSSIPEEMWWLFGTGYLGYTGARSWDKSRNRKQQREVLG